MASGLLVDNAYSITQYPTRLVSANTEDSNKQAFRATNGRRSVGDHWTPVAFNLEAWLRVEEAASATRNGLALDRGHNLAGVSGVQLQRSTDAAFTSPITVITVTIPTAVSPDCSLDTADGCTTPEGAWVKRFTGIASQFWRLLVPAMGPTLKPVVVGLTLGTWYDTFILDRNTRDRDTDLLGTERRNARGGIGRSKLVAGKAGLISLKLEPTAAALTDAITHLEDNWLKGRPGWLVHDDARAELAVLAVRTLGRQGLGFAPDWSARQAALEWVEYFPKVA